MVDKITKPSIDRIMQILDNKSSIEERNYIKNHKLKILTITPKDFISWKLEDRKIYLFNTLTTKTSLDAKSIEFLVVLLENMSVKLSNLFILDDIIDFMINFHSLKDEKDKLWHKLGKFADANNDPNELRYTVTELLSLIFDFAKDNNNKYLFQQADEINFKIKEEFENNYAKIIEFYKNKYHEYKTRYKALLVKSNQIFPNESFQKKVNRVLNKIKNGFYDLKTSLFKKRYGKCYGLCKINIDYIKRIKIGIMQDGLEQEFHVEQTMLDNQIDEVIDKLSDKLKNVYFSLSIEDSTSIKTKIITHNTNLDGKIALAINLLEKFDKNQNINDFENIESSINIISDENSNSNT